MTQQALQPQSQEILGEFCQHLSITLGRDQHSVDDHYRYTALALTARDQLMSRWKATHAAYYKMDCRRGYYLSLEYLIGRSMSNALYNLGILDETRAALAKGGIDMATLEQMEADAGLGNGGLGRLAACFMDSCATLQLPVMGYGIRYEFGMFRQKIRRGVQIEEPDHWLALGSPWELCRPEYTQRIHFGGKTEFVEDINGAWKVRWVDTEDVEAVPYDLPVPGFENGTVNTLRLWKAEATDEFNLREFNEGDYSEAVRAKYQAENISMVLYPNDKSENGKALRLKQQYFLASASLQDIVRRWVRVHGKNFTEFAAKNCFQLNDTHPTIAVAELMRILLDEHNMGWDEAWDITRNTMAYTNHTLLPEALEKWSVELMRSLLPRPLEIIFEINSRFMRQVANRWPGHGEIQSRLSIIEDGPHPHVRMANLAIVGSMSVNGVAELHTKLLKEGLFKDFCELWPHKFNNKTNGVTQRRWLGACNPSLAKLVTDRIGKDWITDLSQLAKLKPLADDAGFQDEWRKMRAINKARLAALVKQECGVTFMPEAMYDVQVKRIHEYKRQLLNALHVVHLYNRIKRGDTRDWTPRCVLIGGKAAPGYVMAKRIIRFVTSLSEVINHDPDCNGLLRVAFLPNYNVSAMESICPGTDLSEQISTAGKEASGTGNMKFMMNGALTIGTLDGANIEIREEVGEDNFFLFGLTAAEVEDGRSAYKPSEIIAKDQDLQAVIRLIESGHFNPHEVGIFDDILRSFTTWGDYWMLVADFHSYIQAQERAAQAFRNPRWWTRASILNTASSGRFSSDRTIGEYNRDIWKLPIIKPVAIEGCPIKF